MKKLAIISTIILGLAATSCNSYLDINESPNSPKESDLNASILFPAAEMNLASSYGDFLRITGGYYAQYYVQSFGTSNYLDYSRFEMSATRSSSTYTQLNTRTLKNLQLVREIAAKNENWGDYSPIRCLLTAMERCLIQRLWMLQIPLLSMMMERPSILVSWQNSTRL